MVDTWKIIETQEGYLGFFKGPALTYSSQVCKMFIHNDGDVWGAYAQGYFADDGAGSVGSPRGGEAYNFDGSRFGDWKVNQTDSNHLGFWKNGDLKMMITNDGRVWGKYANGFFQARSSAFRDSGAVSDTIYTIFEERDWRICETEGAGGALSFRYKKTECMFIHDDGDVWGKAANGYFARRGSTRNPTVTLISSTANPLEWP